MFADVVKNPNFVGSQVQVRILPDDSDDDEQEEYDAVVKTVKLCDSEGKQFSVTFQNCKIIGGKLLPGLHTFEDTQIGDLKVLKEGNGKVESVVLPPKTSFSSRSNGHSTSRTNGHSSKPMGLCGLYRNDNQHLKKLMPVQMPELLAQLQFEKPPVFERLTDEPGRPRKIPRPQQDAIHMEGDKFVHRLNNELKEIRKRIWKDPDTPLDLKYFPSKWFLVEDLIEDKPVFEMALKEIASHKKIGVSLQGKTLCRRGELSTISFSTAESVFTFDIVKLGSIVFDQGLRDILQSSKLEKVFHDCRQASDILFHRFGVKLNNVYDTQAANSVFLTWAYCGGYMPKYTVSYSHIARAYLGIQTSCLFFPHYRMKHAEADMSIWMKRPLTSELEYGILGQTVFLLDLQKATNDAMLSPFRDVTNVLLSDLRDAEDVPNGGRAAESCFLLPPKATEALPRWQPNDCVASKVGVVEGRQIHQAVGQFDPLLIFSRDVLHQNKALKK